MQPVQNKLLDNFSVTPETNIFKVNIHLERFQKVCHVAWKIFSVIVFPIGLTNLLVKIVARQMILQGSTIYNLSERKVDLAYLQKRNEIAPSPALQNRITPLAQHVQYLDNLIGARNAFISNEANHAHQLTVTTADGVDVDTMMIQNEKQLALPAAEQKWIVFFMPNAGVYEECLDYLKAISDATGASVYTGNYRGLMESKGTADSTHDLVLDGEAMVQKLLSSGIPAENIMLHGWSLGGGVAAEVASYHQEKDHEMAVCSDRTFGSLIGAAAGLIRHIGGLLGRIAWLADWKFNNVDSYKKIKPDRRFTIVGKQDQVIAYPVSLYKCFKKACPKNGSPYLKIMGSNSHGVPLHNDLLNAYAGQVKRMLKIA